jgi:hypothetical protein
MQAAELCFAAHTQLLHKLYLGALNLCVLLNSMNDSNLRAGYILLFEIRNYRQLAVQQ